MAKSERAYLWISTFFGNLAADCVRFGLIRHFSRKAQVADRSSIEHPATSIQFPFTNLIVDSIRQSNRPGFLLPSLMRHEDLKWPEISQKPRYSSQMEAGFCIFGGWEAPHLATWPSGPDFLFEGLTCERAS
jgi:hypothetical protein